MSSLQAFGTDRFINTTRQIYPSTTKMPTAMNHILDDSTPHLLDIQSDVSTFQSSDFNQLDFPIDPQKENNGHPSRYSQQAVSFLFGFIWMTIGCLVYILQHSLCMDPGELSCFPESRISSEPGTPLIFQDSGETNPFFPVREPQNDLIMSLMSRDI